MCLFSPWTVSSQQRLLSNSWSRLYLPAPALQQELNKNGVSQLVGQTGVFYGRSFSFDFPPDSKFQGTPSASVTDLILTSINLKEGDGAFAVNLVAWRMAQVTLGLRTRGGSGVAKDGGAVGQYQGPFIPSAAADT